MRTYKSSKTQLSHLHGLCDLVQVVDEVIGEQLQVRRFIDRDTAWGTTSAQRYRPFHCLWAKCRKISLSERFTEAHSEGFRAQPK
ncbi:unnamed protein product, partial [Brenthis ino]